MADLHPRAFAGPEHGLNVETGVDVVSEAELAVLASVLMSSGSCLDEVALTGDDFYAPGRGDLFDAMTQTWSSGTPVEAFTLSEARPGDAAFLFSLTSMTHVRPASVTYYAAIVRKHALRRRLAAVGAGLAQLEGDDTTELAERARAALDAAIGAPVQRLQFVGDILPRLVDRMDAETVFVPSPWPSLNEKIGGFRPGAVYVVAARPGVGKTIIAGQIATHLAQHGAVAFSSLEMADEELVARIVSERLRINVGHIKDARMDTRDWNILASGRHTLEALRIAIDDRAGVSATDVRSFVRAVSKTGPMSCAIVDYLQLMTSRDRMDRHLQVADFSRRLKIMAKDFHIPVVALSQLNRNSESSALAVPKLSDLRESGAIEQDADVVLLLRREGEFPHESLVIDVAKNRHGETGEVSLAWDGGYSRATEWNHTDAEEPR